MDIGDYYWKAAVERIDGIDAFGATLKELLSTITRS